MAWVGLLSTTDATVPLVDPQLALSSFHGVVADTLEADSTLCVISYYQSHYYQPKMAERTQGNDINSICFSHPCMFRKVIRIHLIFSSMHTLGQKFSDLFSHTSQIFKLIFWDCYKNVALCNLNCNKQFINFSDVGVNPFRFSRH